MIHFRLSSNLIRFIQRVLGVLLLLLPSTHAEAQKPQTNGIIEVVRANDSVQAPDPTATNAVYYLLENFSSDMVAGEGAQTTADRATFRVGVAATRIDYNLAGLRNGAICTLQAPRDIPEPGVLKIWIKGDGSTNTLQLDLVAEETFRGQDGSPQRRMIGNLGVQPVSLSSKEWREVSIDIRGPWEQLLKAKRDPNSPMNVRLNGFRLLSVRGGESPTGTVWIDDLRLAPSSQTVAVTGAMGLLGPPIRKLGDQVRLFVDLRVFGEVRDTAKARITVTDRNETPVLEREISISLPPENPETELNIEAGEFAAFLPPFRMVGAISCPSIPMLSVRMDQTMVMGNIRALFEDHSDVLSAWNTRYVLPDFKDEQSKLGWLDGILGNVVEVRVQKQIVVRRENLMAPPVVTDSKAPLPPRDHVLRVDYSKTAAVCRNDPIELPGNPYELGVWVKGDGTTNRLYVQLIDNCGGGRGPGMIAGAYLQKYNIIKPSYFPICALTNTDWQYFTLPLPGSGRGSNLPQGGTAAVDFPLKLTAFVVECDNSQRTNESTFFIGPVTVLTQDAENKALDLSISYDNPYAVFAPESKAWVTVHNGWLAGQRTVKVKWTLLDGEAQEVGSGESELKLASQERKRLAIDLKEHDKVLRTRPAPYVLRITASDAGDAMVNVTRSIVLSRPDSIIQQCDFEEGMSFFNGNGRHPKEGVSVKQTFHAGEGALLLDLKKGQGKHVLLDPPIEGVPVSVEFWMHNTAARGIVYPQIVNKGGSRVGCIADDGRLFIPLDWQGWKKLVFHCPPPGRLQPEVLDGKKPGPLGLHLVVDAREGGNVFVDEVRVAAHLKPEKRLSLAYLQAGKSGVLQGEDRVCLAVINHDAEIRRTATVEASVTDWLGVELAVLKETLPLKPGESRTLTVSKSVPPGAFCLRAKMTEDGIERGQVTEDFVVPSGSMATQLVERVNDMEFLARSVRDDFALIEDDWDWIEFHPGSFQFDSAQELLRRAHVSGRRAFMLLGYGAYFAGGPGYKQLLDNRLSGRDDAGVYGCRDGGHAVDVYFPPERMDDWDIYIHEVMRRLGDSVEGWMLWSNPDGAPPVGIAPEKMAEMIRVADRWRKEYCPEKPLLLGGMLPKTAIDYLARLRESGDLDRISGVQVRMDAGRLPPEDAQLCRFLAALTRSLGHSAETPKRVLVSDLDWAPEATHGGLDILDQAAFMSRSILLFDELGIRPDTSLSGGASGGRYDLGMVYRRTRFCPPFTLTEPDNNIKAIWLAVQRTFAWLDRLDTPQSVQVQDTAPGRTMAMLYPSSGSEGPVLFVWRNNQSGWLSFAGTGMDVVSAEDLFGRTMEQKNGEFPVGRIPVAFRLKPGSGNPNADLRLLQVREWKNPASWPQRTLAVIDAKSGPAYGFEGGLPAEFAGTTVSGEPATWQGLRFDKTGRETLKVRTPADSKGLVLRKRYAMESGGQAMTVSVNDKVIGEWDLRASDGFSSNVLQQSEFVIPDDAAAQGKDCNITISYTAGGNSAGWVIFAYDGSDFPLDVMGPVGVQQNVLEPRIARSIVGSPLWIQETRFEHGVGVLANSLMEYALNGQFKRFSSRIGVDRAAQGRGSVVFEVLADGKSIWKSKTVTGVDAPEKIDLPVDGVKRLRLTVTDAGDGTLGDAADWCDAALHR